MTDSVLWERNVTEVVWQSNTAPGVTFTTIVGGTSTVDTARLLPTGGTDGQVVAKVAGAAAWTDPTGGAEVDPDRLIPEGGDPDSDYLAPGPEWKPLPTGPSSSTESGGIRHLVDIRKAPIGDLSNGMLDRTNGDGYLGVAPIYDRGLFDGGRVAKVIDVPGVGHGFVCDLTNPVPTLCGFFVSHQEGFPAAGVQQTTVLHGTFGEGIFASEDHYAEAHKVFANSAGNEYAWILEHHAFHDDDLGEDVEYLICRISVNGDFEGYQHLVSSGHLDISKGIGQWTWRKEPVDFSDEAAGTHFKVFWEDELIVEATDATYPYRGMTAIGTLQTCPWPEIDRAWITTGWDEADVGIRQRSFGAVEQATAAVDTLPGYRQFVGDSTLLKSDGVLISADTDPQTLTLPTATSMVDGDATKARTFEITAGSSTLTLSSTSPNLITSAAEPAGASTYVIPRDSTAFITTVGVSGWYVQVDTSTSANGLADPSALPDRTVPMADGDGAWSYSRQVATVQDVVTIEADYQAADTALQAEIDGLELNGFITGPLGSNSPNLSAFHTWLLSKLAAGQGISLTVNGSNDIEIAVTSLAITNTNVVNSQAAMLALTAEEGDVAIRTDTSATWILDSGASTSLSSWHQLATPTDAVLSVAGKTGAITLAIADVTGLQTALDAKATPSDISTAIAAIPSGAAAATPALRALGTTSTTAAAGNDSRLSDARTPTAHKSTHATAGSDALSPSDIGAVPTSRTLAGLDLSADRTAPALRTALALVTGTDVQAWDADLDWLAANLTSFARTLLDDTTASQMRGTLGLYQLLSGGAGSGNAASGTPTSLFSSPPTLPALGVGDSVRGSVAFSVLNNSGAGRTYTPGIYIDGTLVQTMTASAALGASATLRAARIQFDLVVTDSTHATLWSNWMLNTTSQAVTTDALTIDLSTAKTIDIRLSVDNATATQTITLQAYSIDPRRK